MQLDKIEQEIIEYFLKEFAKNNLSVVRIRPVEIKYPKQLNFIHNILRHKILKPINQYKFIPRFETIFVSNSEYKKDLVKDIDTIYRYLQDLYSNPDLDEVIITLHDIISYSQLDKLRIFECFYYLSNTGAFVSYSADIKNEKIIFDIERKFLINQEIYKYKSFARYLEQVYEWQNNYEENFAHNNVDDFIAGNTRPQPNELPIVQLDKKMCRARAKEFWADNPTMKIQQIIDSGVLQEYYCTRVEPYTERTFRDWIKDLAPSNKPGRPPKNKY